MVLVVFVLKIRIETLYDITSKYYDIFCDNGTFKNTFYALLTTFATSPRIDGDDFCMLLLFVYFSSKLSTISSLNYPSLY